jgi:hypothetical protein
LSTFRKVILCAAIVNLLLIPLIIAQQEEDFASIVPKHSSFSDVNRPRPLLAMKNDEQAVPVEPTRPQTINSLAQVQGIEGPVTPFLWLANPTISPPNVVNESSVSPSNEPAIAIDPNNPSRIYVGANDYDTPTHVPWLGIYNSTDGGKTWAAGFVPGLPESNDLKDTTSPLRKLGFQAASDPSIAIDDSGFVYYSGVAFNFTGDNSSAIFVAVFNPQGKYVNETIVASFKNTGGESLVSLYDKPWVTVDDTQSRFQGNVYVTFTKFEYAASSHSYINSTIWLAMLRNRGENFVPPTRISDLNHPYDQGSRPAIAANGTLYVVWEGCEGCSLTNPNSPVGHYTIEFVKSSDGGVTFNPATTSIGNVSDISAGISGVNFRMNSFPSIGVGVLGQIYVAWSDGSDSTLRLNESDVLLISSSDYGNSWSEANEVTPDLIGIQYFWPEIVTTQTGMLDLISYNVNASKLNDTINVVFSRSADQGRTFSEWRELTTWFPFSGTVANIFGNQPFFGDYIDAAAAGDRDFIAFTGIVSGMENIMLSLVEENDIVVTLGSNASSSISVDGIVAPGQISSFVGSPGQSYEISLPNVVQVTADIRYNLVSFAQDGQSTNVTRRGSGGNFSLHLISNSNTILTFQYVEQQHPIVFPTDAVYLILTKSPTNDTWFDRDTMIKLSIPYTINIQGNSRENFIGYTSTSGFKSSIRHSAGSDIISLTLSGSPVWLNYTIQYNLTISQNFGGEISSVTSPTGDSWYDSGTMVVLTERPIVFYSFEHWIVDGQNQSTSPSLIVLMDKAHVISASFVLNFEELVIVTTLIGVSGSAIGLFFLRPRK